MCWSGEASALLAAGGFATAGYAAYKKESPRIWGTIIYFSLMELLQAFTYGVVDQCSFASNQIATLLGYFHICFQPFFINMLSLYFVPQAVRKKVEHPVYALCFVCSIFMLIQLYPFDWAGHCAEGSILCGSRLCSVSGNWHIAWEIPLNGLTNFLNVVPLCYITSTFPSYILAGFVVPILYGSWRFTIYHIIVGPVLAMMLTSDPNEMPAVWCLFSLAILLLVINTPIRQYMHVRRWPLWFGMAGR